MTPGKPKIIPKKQTYTSPEISPFVQKNNVPSSMNTWLYEMQPMHDYVHRKFGKVYITTQAQAVETALWCGKAMWVMYNSYASRQDLE